MTNRKFRITSSMYVWLFRQNQWATKAFLFWLISLIPIVNLVTNGYILRTINNSLHDEGLPDWKNIRELIHFTYGSFVITIVYLIIALVIGAIGCFAFSLIPKVGLGICIAWVFFLAVIYQLISFVGIIRFVKWDSFRERLLLSSKYC